VSLSGAAAPRRPRDAPHKLSSSQAHKPTALLLDQILPIYHARERHATVIRAPIERAYEALWSANLAPVGVRVLMGIRALPVVLLAAFGQPRGAWGRFRERTAARVTMRDIEARGFTVIAADPPREVVLAVVGAFWRLRGEMRRVDAESFRGPQPAGTARAAWNFHLAERADGACELSTETRVHCADEASRRRFRLYWIVVRPGSGLIRRLMLRSVRKAAEG
jgi:hypothetical protein